MIALDLDNTTLYDSDSISPGNRRALEDAIAEGIEIVVASGRVFTSLPACVLEIPGVRYAITSNGAAVYRLPSHADSVEERFSRARRIRRVGLPGDRILAILALLEEYPSDRYPVSFETFIDGKAYGYADYVRDPVRYGASPRYIAYVQKTRTMVEDIRGFVRENADRIDGLDLQVGPMEVDGEPLVDVLRRRISEEIPDIYMTSSVPNRIEMANAAAGKASGIRYMMNILGIGRRQTAAFGDADNDVDMLKAAGIGIAVANGTARCRKAADHVTKACREDGVAWAFYRRLGVRNRLAEKEKYMRAALREAQKAAACDEVPIGCVIVKDGKILARGYNRRNTDSNTLSHAETNAIRKACRKLGDWRLDGCVMYVTLEPCPMCAGAIVQSRIEAVVIGCRSPRTGCAGTVTDLMHVPQFGHQVRTETGILEEECSSLLSGYFEGLRRRRDKPDSESTEAGRQEFCPDEKK